MPTPEHRGIINRQNLPYFKQFLAEHGWVSKELVGEYEVLRMTHERWPAPLLVYRNVRNDDLTTANAAYSWAMMFRSWSRAMDYHKTTRKGQ